MNTPHPQQHPYLVISSRIIKNKQTADTFLLLNKFHLNNQRRANETETATGTSLFAGTLEYLNRLD